MQHRFTLLRRVCMGSGQRGRRAVLTAVFLLVLLAGQSVITNGVQAEPIRIAIYGDSFATGIYFGMRDVLPKLPEVSISRRTKGGTGLVSDGDYEWIRQVGEFVHADRPNIVIVSLGGNDLKDLHFRDLTVKRFSDLWWREYVRRAERVMLDLRAAGSTVYWVGIPIVRSEHLMRDYRKLNGLYRELTRQYGIHYIDLGTAFRGPNRGYTPFETVAGQRKRLRHTDGIHFTEWGNLRLAQLIANAIRQQMASVR